MLSMRTETARCACKAAGTSEGSSPWSILGGFLIALIVLLAIPSAIPVLASELGELVASQVSETSYRHYLDDVLYAHDGDDRGRDGPEHELAMNNIVATFESFGLAVELDPFEYDGETHYNVIATQVGTLFPDSCYVVGAHYDSVGNPGADDDASGVAAVLEVARVLSTYETAHSIKYMAFDLEEWGLVGSKAYVAGHSADDVRGMIQLDMIAWDWGGYGCSVLSQPMTNPWKSAVASALSEYAVALTVVTDEADQGRSDHRSFYEGGYSACLLIEENFEDNPCYHSGCDSVDTPDYISYELATDVTRGVAGCLADQTWAYPPIDCESGDGCALGEYGDSDCNANGIWDVCDVVCGTSEDVNANSIPDECEPRQTLYVDWANCPSQGTGTEEDPFCTIQAALDVAEDGVGEIVEIIVADGVYTGAGNRDLDFGGKVLTLRSENGAKHCTIDCEDAGRAFIFQNGETRLSVLRGFTLTRGYSSEDGGAIACLDGAVPTITNCIFSNNTSDAMGGAVYWESGNVIMSNCVMTGNSAGTYGGAIGWYSAQRSILEHCVIQGNSAESEGGGAYMEWGTRPTFRNCIIRDNTPDQIDTSIYAAGRVVAESCNIAGGWEGEGNIDVRPGYAMPGDYHLTADSACIDAGVGIMTEGSVQEDFEGGERPLDGDGDGIATPDIGAYEFNRDAPVIVLSEEYFNIAAPWNGIPPEPIELQICNAGGQALNWQFVEDYPWLEVSPASGTSTGELDTVRLHIDATGLMPGDRHDATITVESADGTARPRRVKVSMLVTEARRVPSEYATIQAAIDACAYRDVVLIADGVYTGEGNRDLDFGGRIITVRSENGPNNCIIDCEGTGRGFYFHNGETNDAVVQGLTVRRADESGVYCSQSSPTIRQCVLVQNKAESGLGGAGVLCARSNALVVECLIEENRAGTSGGGGIGIYRGSPTIADCRILRNYSSLKGGGIRSDNGTPTIRRCVVTQNTSNDSGGGLSVSGDLMMLDSIISENSARTGGGLTLGSGGDAILFRCSILDNIGTDSGGGLSLGQDAVLVDCIIENNKARDGSGASCYDCAPSFAHCVFRGNTARRRGGGLYSNGCEGLNLTNCVLWGDSPEEIFTFSDSLSVSHCDIRGGWSGEGNIDADPLFAFSGDYHVMSDSPCIDAGTNLLPAGLVREDRDGRTGPLDGDGDGMSIADIGTHEHAFGHPGIAVSPTALTISASHGDEHLAHRVFRIRNSGTGVLNWEIVEGCPWLEVEPAFGSCSSEAVECVVHFDTAALSRGWHQAEIRIAADDETLTPRLIPVVLHVHRTLQVPAEYPTIQAAVDASESKDEVLLADGVYTGPGNRDVEISDKSITVRSEGGAVNCMIDCEGLGRAFCSGGFGDYGGYWRIALQGLTIVNGDATDAGSQSPGYGGAVFCLGPSLDIAECRIADNFAPNEGGGVFHVGNCLEITNSEFINNHTSSLFRGTLSASVGAQGLRIIGCTMVDGGASGAGGHGVYVQHYSQSEVTFANSIIRIGDNASLYVESGSSASPPTVTYSNIAGGWEGEGNIDADPLFVDPDGPDDDPATWEDNDYRLSAGSPCIDAGSNLVVPLDERDLDADGDTNERIPFDLAGFARFIDDPMTPDTGLAAPPAHLAIVDIGAYEFQALPNDCNDNGIPDDEDIASGFSEDCDSNGIPDECELCGDLNDDGSVDYDDYVIFLAAFGGVVDGVPPEDACCDADDSGDIGMADFAAWLACYRDFIGDPLADAPTAPTDPTDEGFSRRKPGESRTDCKVRLSQGETADRVEAGAGTAARAGEGELRKQ